MGGFNTSVPMPSPVALDVRPPEIQDPLQAVMQFRAQQQERQLRGQQIQLGQLQTQEAQMNLEQRRAINDAYRQAFTPQEDGSVTLDENKLSQALAAGGHGEALPAIMESYTKYKQALATLQDTQQKNATAEADAGGRLAAAVKAASYSPELFHTLLTDSMNRGVISRQHFGPIDAAIMQAYQQDPSGAKARALITPQIDQMLAGSPKQQELANQAKSAEGASQRGAAAMANATREQATADLKNASAALGAAATPAEYQQKLDALPHGLAVKFPAATEVFGPDGKPIAEGLQRVRYVGMTPAEQNAAATKPERAMTEAELATVATDPRQPPEKRAAANAALKRLDQSKLAARPIIQTTIPGLGPGQSGAGAPQLSGEAYLNTLPAATANQVRAIAEGRAALPSAATRSQGALQLRQAVFQYDPTFSEQRTQVRKAFTTGPDGKNIGALNTASVHLDQLADAATAMGNGSFKPGNELWNRLRTTFGNAMPTNFNGVKAAVKSEMASALKGNATDQEINEIGATIDSSSSPQQLAGIVETNLHILGAKLNTYRERYQQQMPADTVWSPVLPSARAVYQKHGFDPTAGPQANITPGNGGQRPTGTQPGKYKAGDTRTVNGVVYQRDNAGVWHPQAQPKR